MNIVELDIRDLRDLPSPPFGGEAVYLIAHRDHDVLGAGFMPPQQDAAGVAAWLAEQFGDEYRQRAVAAAIGHPERWQLPAPAPRPEVSVVVCTVDRLVQASRCLRALREQLGSGDELLLVDNSAGGSARELAAQVGSRWIHERRRGSSAARNRGWREARHALVAYVDDDCVPDRAFLDALLEPFADAQVAGVTGSVLARRIDLAVPVLLDKRYPFHRGWETARFAGSTGTTTSPFDSWRLGTGAAMAWRRDLLEGLGGFDPALGAGTPTAGAEELDLFRRALDSGLTVVYRPDALVLHDHPETLRALRRMLIGYGRAQGAHLAKVLIEERRGRRAAVRAVLAEWRWQLRWARRELLNLALGRPRFSVLGLAAQHPAMLLGAGAFLRHRRALRAAAP